jgi:hypothetical protein
VQYLSIRYTERLAANGVVNSVGSPGDSYDNALTESIIGLYKTELVRNRGPWRGLDDLELATLEWVNWFNHRQLFEDHGRVPPAEFEQRYRQNLSADQAETRTCEPARNPGRFNLSPPHARGGGPKALPSTGQSAGSSPWTRPWLRRWLSVAVTRSEGSQSGPLHEHSDNLRRAERAVRRGEHGDDGGGPACAGQLRLVGPGPQHPDLRFEPCGACVEERELLANRCELPCAALHGPR